MGKPISAAVLQRLPSYYRILKKLDEKGIVKVSSKEIAGFLGTTDSQVRQDFYTNLKLGKKGYGYEVKVLKEALRDFLGLDEEKNVIVIGAGNIGKAMSAYYGFREENFNFKALFDILEPEKIKKNSETPIYHVSELPKYIKNNQIDIAVIATPRNVAQKTVDLLVNNGIKNIWNFATVNLVVPEDVVLENIFMCDSLYMLSYKMKNKE